MGCRKLVGCVLLLAALASAEKWPTWMLSIGAGAGGTGLESLLDQNEFSSAVFGVKHRITASDWVGLVYGRHLFPVVMDGAYRHPNDLHTLVPTYSWMSFGNVGYLAVNAGLGPFLLQRNNGPVQCGDANTRNGPSSCATGSEVPTIWAYDLGLLAPLGLEAAVRYGYLVLNFQPEVGAIIPMSGRPAVDYWVGFKMNWAVCF